VISSADFTQNQEKIITVRSLTEALVARSKPRSKFYIIRDQKLKGFHLKISPPGRRRYALDVTRGGFRHYEEIGDADQISLEDALLQKHGGGSDQSRGCGGMVWGVKPYAGRGEPSRACAFRHYE